VVAVPAASVLSSLQPQLEANISHFEKLVLTHMETDGSLPSQKYPFMCEFIDSFAVEIVSLSHYDRMDDLPSVAICCIVIPTPYQMLQFG
jgi:hypothetical protein